MPHSSDDEHDEDERPAISTYVTRLVTNERRATPQKNNENLLDRFQSSSSFQRSIDSSFSTRSFGPFLFSRSGWAQNYKKSVEVLRDDDDFEEEEEEVKDLPFQPAFRPPSRAASTPARVPSLIRPSSPPASRARSPSPPSVPMRSTFTVNVNNAAADDNFRSSTYEQKPLDSQKLKSKWEVRLPQLLSAPVGPDRQVRRETRRGHRTFCLFPFQSLEKTRRHTTEIIYQKANAKSEDVRRRSCLRVETFVLLLSFIFRNRTASPPRNVETSIRWSNS